MVLVVLTVDSCNVRAFFL